MKFDDFIQCCVMLRSLTESFKKLDTNRNGVIQINYEQVGVVKQKVGVATGISTSSHPNLRTKH